MEGRSTMNGVALGKMEGHSNMNGVALRIMHWNYTLGIIHCAQIAQETPQRGESPLGF